MNQTCKHDEGKPRLELVPPAIIEAVGEVRTYGVEKYSDPDNWKLVDKERYKGALMRHLCEYLRDENSVDEESGLSHLKHIACNVAFLLEMQTEDFREEQATNKLFQAAAELGLEIAIRPKEGS
jgi:hypothetical protein